MTEPTNILQTKVDHALAFLVDQTSNRCPITLIAFYNNGRSEGMAFGSSLPSFELAIATLEARVSRWCGAPVKPHEAAEWLPDATELGRIAEFCRDALPFAAGFMLFFGTGYDHAYASFQQQKDMLPFLHEVVLPQLKAQLVLAPQTESAS